MNEKELRRKAARLARECRAIERKGDWTIKGWNDQVRATVQGYMKNTRYFHQVHGMWDCN